VPWVVQVDRLGQAQAVAPATADYQPTDPQIAFYLARFIEQVRSIPADAIIVRQNWLRAYDFTTQGGALALNDYARANDPFAKVGKQQVAVEVSSVIRASPTSFRVAWIERRYQDGRSPAPNAGPPSSPSPCSRRATPTRCGRTRSESTSTPSTGRRSLDNDTSTPQSRRLECRTSGFRNASLAALLLSASALAGCAGIYRRRRFPMTMRRPPSSPPIRRSPCRWSNCRSRCRFPAS
jgi:hypothetical protein